MEVKKEGGGSGLLRGNGEEVETLLSVIFGRESGDVLAGKLIISSSVYHCRVSNRWKSHNPSNPALLTSGMMSQTFRLINFIFVKSVLLTLRRCSPCSN